MLEPGVMHCLAWAGGGNGTVCSQWAQPARALHRQTPRCSWPRSAAGVWPARSGAIRRPLCCRRWCKGLTTAESVARATISDIRAPASRSPIAPLSPPGIEVARPESAWMAKHAGAKAIPRASRAASRAGRAIAARASSKVARRAAVPALRGCPVRAARRRSDEARRRRAWLQWSDQAEFIMSALVMQRRTGPAGRAPRSNWNVFYPSP